ncbi:hypothetical protein SE959_10735 [Escherichia coli]|nr:hypothetical protein [Escherichia coli]
MKAVRLLCDKNDQLKKSIKYFIGIFADTLSLRHLQNYCLGNKE